MVSNIAVVNNWENADQIIEIIDGFEIPEGLKTKIKLQISN